MKFSSWVPKEVKQRHLAVFPKSLTISSADIGHSGREYLEKLLASNDAAITLTWTAIENTLTKKHLKQAEEYPENFNIHIEAHRFMFGALMVSSIHPPAWLVGDFSGVNRTQEFLDKKRDVIALTSFIKRTETDYPLHQFKVIDNELSGMSTTISAMIHTLQHLSKDPNISDDIQLLRKNLNKISSNLRTLRTPKLSDLLNETIQVFDLIQNYEIDFSQNKKYRNSRRNFFIYKLSQYFTEHLGSPRNSDVANIVRVIFDLESFSIGSVKSINRKIKQQLGSRFL